MMHKGFDRALEAAIISLLPTGDVDVLCTLLEGFIVTGVLGSGDSALTHG
jgi:hypothetical protein